MKTIASIAIATIALFATPALKASDCGHHKHHHITTGSFGVSYAPRYVTTRELYRSVQSQWSYDQHGHIIACNVLVITYADYYSDGSTRTYTRSYHM
jgi:hypothetical protein